MYWTFQHFFSNDTTDVNACSEEQSPCACSWSLGWLESTTHELVESDEIQDSYCFALGVAFRTWLCDVLLLLLFCSRTPLTS